MGRADRRFETSDPAGAKGDNERRPGFRAAGMAASRLAIPIISKRRGGILVRLKSEWAVIVGRDWAHATWPCALGRDGVLKLRAGLGAAVEVQHRAPMLIDRINSFLGRTVITRLTLVQGPLPLSSPRASRIPRPLAPAEARALDERLCDIADPELRDALARLGRAVIGEES
jgi:hypothetical protein